MNIKKCCQTSLSLIGAMLIANVCMASPLTDYSQGNVSLDVSIASDTKVKITHHVADNPDTIDSLNAKSNNVAYNLTVGLGGVGIQYRNSPMQTVTGYADYLLSDVSHNPTFQEVNVLKQVNKNIAGFIGYHQAQDTFTIVDTREIKTDRKNTLQVGVIGKSALSKDAELFGIMAFGKDLTSYEAGITQKLGKGWAINLSYREKEVKNLELHDELVGDWKSDVKVSGVNWGVTYSF